jgi:hypothetical protein
MTPCACPSGQVKQSGPSCEILKCVVPKSKIDTMQLPNIMYDYFLNHELGLSKLHSLFIATIEPIRPGKKYPRKHHVQKRGFFPCYKSIR